VSWTILEVISHYSRRSSEQRILIMWLVESKICPLGLNTRCQWPKDNALQNAYMTTHFVSFGTKSLSSGGKFVHNIYVNPNSPWADKFFYPNLYKIHNLNTLWTFSLSSRGKFVRGSLDPMAVGEAPLMYYGTWVLEARSLNTWYEDCNWTFLLLYKDISVYLCAIYKLSLVDKWFKKSF
jgi:hypothetical protein